MWLLFAVIAPLVALVGGKAEARADLVGYAKVIDGDTVEIAGESIRLHGIDAPESGQYCVVDGFPYPCGVMATAWLVDRTLGREIRCQLRTQDRYGRPVAICFVDGKSLNEMIVTAGWAVAFRRYSREFVTQEAEARLQRKGIWRGPFVFPVAWRRGDREPRVYVFDDKCPVKGNVTAKGDHIYHAEGGRHYERLNLNPEEGDRCFQSITDAVDAGFRPAGGK